MILLSMIRNSLKSILIIGPTKWNLNCSVLILPGCHNKIFMAFGQVKVRDHVSYHAFVPSSHCPFVLPFLSPQLMQTIKTVFARSARALRMLCRRPTPEPLVDSFCFSSSCLELLQFPFWYPPDCGWISRNWGHNSGLGSGQFSNNVQ